MTHKEIEVYRQRLAQIKIDLKGKSKREQRITELLSLAMEVGASTGRQRADDGGVDPVGLVNNIHIALQTAAVIDMCKTATEGYEMATKANRNACINFWIAAAIAFLSAVAAWVVALSR
ncbi:MAG: hypothetical protein ACYS1A_02115 [Planctomycetota bacterium]|jgi:hypothetical protein